MKLNFKNDEVSVIKLKKDYSIKLEKSRIGNILPRMDGNYLKCRRQEYADFLPVEYNIKFTFKETRNYCTYITTSPVSDRQIEKWVDQCVEYGINKRLDHRG